ncbi:MAG: alpha/beta fold hydrolase [Clostridia bacterium]|nr:alpha/beta fold hydrolase [Clostridia bacterium]
MYTKHKWQSDVHYNFGYVKYLPKDFDESKRYPLVFFLHGAGERGDDLDVAMRHGYMKHVRESGQEYPFIFIAPQCPQGKIWGCYTESLLAFLDYICDTLPVDRDRVYLTGLSMGGTGSWMLAMAAPERFAALVPVCGSGIYWCGGALTEIPIYIYHGDCDEVVPIGNSIEMLTSVNKRGGHAQIKILYGVKHNAWDAAYSDDELLSWLLQQKRTCRENGQ